MTVGTGTGSTFGDDNYVRPTSTNAFLNLKGGSGKAKITLGNEAVLISSGNPTGYISFFNDATSSTNAGTEAMRIASGNVGIGTTNPGFNLDVNGTAHVGNDLYLTRSDGYATASIVVDNSTTTAVNISKVGGGNINNVGLFANNTTAYGNIVLNSSVPLIVLKSASGNNSALRFVDDNTNKADLYYSASSGSINIANIGGGNLGWVYQLNAGNIGIGTTNPAAALEINRTDNAELLRLASTSLPNLFHLKLTGVSGSTGDYRFQVVDNGGTSDVLYFKGNGNVGIGTTNPVAGLDVRSSANGSNLQIGPVDGVSEGGQVSWQGSSSYSAWTQDIFQNKMRFMPNSATDDQFQIYNIGAGTAGLYVQGNMSVGTPSPNYQFDVLSSLVGTTHRSNVVGGLRINGNGRNVTFRLSDSVTNSSDISLTGNTVQLSVNGISSIHYNDTGNVGIGTVNPAAKLEVAGTTYSSYNGGAPHFHAHNSSSGNTEYNFILSGNNDAGQGAVHFINSSTRSSDGGANTYTIRNDLGTLRLGHTSHPILFDGSVFSFNSGNVGIGTASPTVKLHVSGGRTWLDNNSGDSGVRALGTTISSAPGSNFTAGVDPGDALRSLSVIAKGSTRPAIFTLRNADNSNAFWDFVADGNTDKFFIQKYTSTPAVTIDGNNNVGIGTTSPSAKLTVAGDAAVDGAFFVRNSTTTGDFGRILHSGSTGNLHIDTFTGATYLNWYGGSSLYVGRADGMNSALYVRSSDGNVGIDSTNPSATLEIYGSNKNLRFVNESTGANQIDFYNNTSQRAFVQWSEAGGDLNIGTISSSANWDLNLMTGNTNRLTIKNDGLVGIGTSAPSKTLHVVGTALVESSTNADTRTLNTSDGWVQLGLQRNKTSGSYNTNWELYIPTNSTNFRLNNGTFGDVLTATTSGNIGIGTNTPFSPLEVSRFVSGGAPATTGITDTNVLNRLRSNVVGLDTGVMSNGNIWLQNRNVTDFSVNYPLLLNPNGGNVGIGTVSPNAKLDVLGGVRATGFDFQDASGNQMPNAWIGTATNVDGASNKWLHIGGITDNTDGTGIKRRIGLFADLLYLGGKIGIGQISPNTNLHVVGGNNNDYGQLEISTADSDARISLYNSGKNASNSTASTRGDINMSASSGYEGMRFMINGLDKMILNSSGNVGIGTTNPGSKLEVNGNINANAYLFGNWNVNTTAWPGTGGFSYAGGDVIFGISSTTGQASLQVDGGFIQGESGKNNVFLGSVGIGTATPSAPLHVKGLASGGETLRLSPLNTGNEGGQLTLMDGTGTGGWEIDNYGADGSETLRFFRDKGENNILNALVINTSGNVGIGTSSSIFRTEISYDNNSSVLLLRNPNSSASTAGSTVLQMRTGSDTGNTNWFNIEADRSNGYVSFNSGANFARYAFLNGKVGVGAAPKSVSTANFETTADMILSASGSANTIHYNSYFDNTWRAYGTGYSAALRFDTTNGQFQIWNSPASVSPGDVSNISAKLIVNASGNIGIGTTSPGVKMDVLGTDLGGAQGQFASNNTGGGRAGINIVHTSAAGGLTLQQLSNGVADIANYSGAQMAFNAKGAGGYYTFHTTDSNTPRLTILNGGNVGIGATNPLNKLHITDSSAGSGQLLLDNATNVKLWFSAHTDGYAAIDAFNQNNSAKLNLALSPWGGNVGIGTTNPQQKFEVNGVIRVQNGELNFDQGTQFSGFQIRRSNDAASGNILAWQVKATESLPIVMGTNNAPRMIIDVSGNVGIGTSNPAIKFEVNSELKLVDTAIGMRWSK